MNNLEGLMLSIALLHDRDQDTRTLRSHPELSIANKQERHWQRIAYPFRESVSSNLSAATANDGPRGGSLRIGRNEQVNNRLMLFECPDDLNSGSRGGPKTPHPRIAFLITSTIGMRNRRIQDVL